MKKYLILTASYGSGHNAARDALKDEILRRGDMVESLDFGELLKNKGGRSIAGFYAFATEQAPILWQIVFNLLDIETLNEVVKTYLKTVSQGAFNRFVKKYEPDIVISVYPLWPAFIENYIEKYRKTFSTGVIITDSMETYIGWYVGSKITDYYFVIDSFTKEIFKERFQHENDNVYTSFFPIKKEYFLDKPTIKAETIALLLTGMGKPFAEEMMQKLIEETPIKNIVVIGGRNARLFKALKAKFSNEKINFYSFLNIKENLKDIDFLISKPGGAILSECIAQDVILIAPSFFPGQEEGNIKLMQQAQIGIFEPEPQKIIDYLRNTNFNEYLPNFKKVKNKNSVKFILETMHSQKID